MKKKEFGQFENNSPLVTEKSSYLMQLHNNDCIEHHNLLSRYCNNNLTKITALY